MVHSAWLAFFLAASPEDSMVKARAALAGGDPITAVDTVRQAVERFPADGNLKRLGAALIQDAFPHQARQLRLQAGGPPPPLTPIPPEVAASAGAAAWVNVSVAPLRAKPNDKAKTVDQLRIATEVVADKASGAFFQVKVIGAKGRTTRGFIHRDHLTGRKPTTAELIARADRAGAGSKDEALSMLWRALHLEPTRSLYERALGLAFETRRYELVPEMLRLATAAQLWSLEPTDEPEAVRLALYRAAVARNGKVFAALTATLWCSPCASPERIERDECHYRPIPPALDAGATSDLWRAAQRVLLTPLTRTEDAWGFGAGSHYVELANTRPPEGAQGPKEWRVRDVGLPTLDSSEEQEGKDCFGQEPLLKELRERAAVTTPPFARRFDLVLDGWNVTQWTGPERITPELKAALLSTLRPILEAKLPELAPCFAEVDSKTKLRLELQIMKADGRVASASADPQSGLDGKARYECLQRVTAKAVSFPTQAERSELATDYLVSADVGIRERP